MALTPRLDLRQSQALVMTPQLQQAIKLLQLNNLELSAYVDQELEENPLLERDEGDQSPEDPGEPTDDDFDAAADDVADGGDGTLDALVNATDGAFHETKSPGPWGHLLMRVGVCLATV